MHTQYSARSSIVVYTRGGVICAESLHFSDFHSLDFHAITFERRIFTKIAIFKIKPV